MDKIAGILLVAILAIVSVASLTYYVLNQSNQTQNNLSPIPTPTPSPSEEPTGLDSIPTPSIPEFTLGFVNKSHYSSPVYEVSPYTGEKDVLVEPGHYEDERYVEVNITNQQVSLTSTRLENYTNLYYKIRVKGHYEDEWVEAPHLMPSHYRYHNASDYAYTVILVEISAQNSLRNVPSGGEIDVQVEALIGQVIKTKIMIYGEESYSYKFVGEESGWSSTQTIVIP